MAQITNADTFTLIIHTGYDQRLSTIAMRSSGFKNKNLEDVFSTFVDETVDSEDDPYYIIAVSGKGGVKAERFGTLAPTYPSILLDLATVAEKEIVESHICVGNVTLAKSFDLVQALTNPGRYTPKPYFFFTCYGTDSVEIKTATSGRRFIIIELATESG